MLIYTIKRLLVMVPLLLVISFISFFIMYMAPGGPTGMMLDPKLSAEAAKQIKTNLGLDQPVHIQYIQWLNRLIHLDFGRSFMDGESVLSKIATYAPNTLLLMGTAFILSLVLGCVIGIIGALNKGTKLDQAITLLTFASFSIPGFWLSIMFIFIFAVIFGILPSGGIGEVSDGSILLTMIMPVSVLVIGYSAGIARYMRQSMIEILGSTYIRSAVARGFSYNEAVLRYGIPTAMMPIITLIGLSIPDLFGGAFIVETVFNWPGMGRLAIDAIFQRDYPLIMGIVMLSAFLVIIGNFIADMAYILLDPRVRKKR